MNRLGSRSNRLLDVAVLKNPWFSAQFGGKKKKLIWHSAWFKVRKLKQFFPVVVHTWACAQLSTQLLGVVYMVMALHRAFPSTSPTHISPLPPPWGDVQELPSTAVPGPWGLPSGKLLLSWEGRGHVGFCPVWSKPTHYFETSTLAPLAGLSSCHLASGVSPEIFKIVTIPSSHLLNAPPFFLPLLYFSL